MIFTQTMDTSIGRLSIQTNESEVIRISGDKSFTPQCSEGVMPEIMIKTITQLDEYFNGKRKEFDLPLVSVGTDFQRKVWKISSEIPYSKVITYKELACAVSSERHSRAVANSLHNNPFLIVVPCHRIVGSNGSLTGFALGLDVKRKLLDLEKENL